MTKHKIQALKNHISYTWKEDQVTPNFNQKGAN